LAQIDFADKGFIIKTMFSWAILVTHLESFSKHSQFLTMFTIFLFSVTLQYQQTVL